MVTVAVTVAFPTNQRSGRFVVVLEGVIDLHNVHACLRTAEAMGVQRVFIVRPPPGSLIK